MPVETWQGRLLVRGAGLIGTSVALAARAAGADVVVDDPDADRLSVAVSLGAGRRLDEVGPDAANPFDLTVVAAPPAVVAAVATADLRTGTSRTVTHVSSIQSRPQRDIETSGVSMRRFVGSHPVAGREVSGPAYGSADLFRDRPWIVCPAAASDADAVAAVVALARACGADPIVLDAQTHDTVFARLSHVPQLVASALAASIGSLPPDQVALAGGGLRDTTRVADSQPGMWAEIAAANAPAIAAALGALAADLTAVAAALDEPDRAAAAVRDLVERGRAGRALLPGKHGGAPLARAEVEVVVPDTAGALAALLGEVARQEVNLEDLRVDHAPGHPAGVAQLVVEPGARERLIDHLRRAGWAVTAGPTTAV